ncbi:unnamed protein product [Coffea canephora]|uniref:DH200=94 genomic scaffold, scaffold_67 n=1 Tax=Coffea canephora TaxID=49390 RepID=A0A068UVR6_COFCA|nr:unnamed protein product [Coffea canephora]
MKKEEEYSPFVELHYTWNSIPGLLRCGKSCRLRWIKLLYTKYVFFLFFSFLLTNKCFLFFCRWFAIANRLPG